MLWKTKFTRAELFYHRTYRISDRGVLTNVFKLIYLNFDLIVVVGLMTISFQFCILCSLTLSYYSHKISEK